MKVVRLVNNVVSEIIPEEATPVSYWYGEQFASECVDAPDEVGQRWIYDPDTKTFSEPPPYKRPEYESEDFNLMAQAMKDGVSL